jgi:hypothetical protein
MRRIGDSAAPSLALPQKLAGTKVDLIVPSPFKGEG